MPKFKQNGFSLVELMIVVAIIGITAAFAIPSYKIWIQNTRIRSVAESLQNGLQIARAEALRRNAKVRFTLAANGSWQVGCVNPATCGANIQSAPAEPSGEVVVSTNNGNLSITFDNLGMRDITGGAVFFNRATINNPTMAAADSRDLAILVKTGGGVKMCDPNVVAPDLRECI